MHARRLLTAVALCLTLAACGGSDADAPSASGAKDSVAPARSTVAHKFGTTTVEGTPKRVVVVGLREVDALLALDVVPVAITKWLPESIHPWARAALGDAKEPVVLSSDDGIDVEQVAAQRPDLIVATYSNLTRKDYARLSKLAPVVAQPKGVPDFGSSWQQDTQMIGQALGKADAAQQLVEDTEAELAQAKADHPEFQGQTAAMAMDYQGAFVYGVADVRTRFLEDLGFTFPPALAKRFKDEFGAQLSAERLDLLDVGVMAWITQEEHGAQKLRRLPVYRDLAVRREGRDVFLEPEDPGFYAVPFQTVLSIPTLIAEVVPRLAAAADGDPSTSTEE